MDARGLDLPKAMRHGRAVQLALYVMEHVQETGVGHRMTTRCPTLFDPVIPSTPPGESSTYLDENGRRVTRLPPGIADGVVPSLTALPAKAATDVE